MHRDIKPDNFVVGIGDSSNTVFLIDYGLAKRYRDTNTLVHISYRDHKKLTGTTRYASLSTHLGIEQSRRDDLECLAYTLIYLAAGELPWQGLPAKNKAQKYQRIQEKKGNTPPEELCKNLEPEFAKYLIYCRSLKFEDKPDYNYTRKLFKDCYYRKKYDKGFAYDWIKLGINLDTILEKDWSSTGTNHAENEEPPKRNELLVPHAESPESPKWSVSQQSATHSFVSKQEGGLGVARASATLEQA